jgi:muramidase (phage lysozyme)
MLGLAAGAGALVVMRSSFAGNIDAYGDERSTLDGYGDAYAPIGGDAFSFVNDIADKIGTTLTDFVNGGPAAEELDDMTAESNVSAFLNMLRVGEGTSGPDGYRTMFGGGLFDSFADHPRIRNRATFANGKTVTSTAAGAYQFLETTWDECQRVLGLPDFSPASQDAAAVYLIRRRGALADVRAGRITDAIRKCNREWASLPGSPYGQPTVTLDGALASYENAGGSYA